MVVLGQQPLKNLGSVQTHWAFCYFPSVHLRASIKFPLGLESSDNDNAFSTQND